MFLIFVKKKLFDNVQLMYSLTLMLLLPVTSALGEETFCCLQTCLLVLNDPEIHHRVLHLCTSVRLNGLNSRGFISCFRGR